MSDDSDADLIGLIQTVASTATPTDTIATRAYVTEDVVNHVIEFGTPRQPSPTRVSER